MLSDSKATVSPRLQLALAWCRWRSTVGCWPLEPPLAFNGPPVEGRATVQVPSHYFFSGCSGGRNILRRQDVGYPRSTDGIFWNRQAESRFFPHTASSLCMTGGCRDTVLRRAAGSVEGGHSGDRRGQRGRFWLFHRGRGVGGRGCQSRPSGDAGSVGGTAVVTVGAATVEDTASSAATGEPGGTGGGDTPRGHKAQYASVRMTRKSVKDDSLVGGILHV
jgi:hypothetical protein